MEQQRVLFVRLRSLGDTVLMTPALEVAARAGCRASVVCEAPFHRILDGNPFIDRCFVVDRSSKLFSRCRTVREIRAYRPDIAIDLHGGSTSGLMTFFSGAREKVGYAGSRHSFFYNRRIPPSREIWGRDSLHTVEHQLTPLKALEFPVEPIPRVRVEVSGRAREEIEELLAGKGLTEEFILIHPAAAFETKQWDRARFAELARRLIAAGQRVAVTVGPGQEALLELEVERLAVIPPLPLDRFSALAERCRLYIGNDTGPTHIAAALGRKIVVIFGSSDFKVWHPWQTEHRLIRSDLACIPCPGYYCLHYSEPRCIRSVQVDEVYEAALELLD